jgi:H+/Cl- antiporter ClcA
MAKNSVASASIPRNLLQPGAFAFWVAVLLIGIGAGAGAGVLTRLLELIQRLLWSGSGRDILEAASHVNALKHIEILLGAGLVTVLGQLLLVRLTSGNGIDITAAIWFKAGRLPALRTIGSAILSVILVGMGVSLGREGAPKQLGAVIANTFSDRIKLSDEERRLLVACGAGAGMAAAYGVPLGGALFSLEVLRGMLALRLVLPALLTALIATTVSWAILPNAPTYFIPEYPSTFSAYSFALLLGPIAGVLSVIYVRSIAWADRSKPHGVFRWIVWAEV